MEIRFEIIEKTLKIESLLTDCLLVLFRFDRRKDVKTLGKQGTALPAISKAYLLDDFDYLPKYGFSKIQKILEIRNKFAHIESIKTLIDLNSYYPSYFNFIAEKYPSLDLGKEKDEVKLKKLTDVIFADVIKFLQDLYTSLLAGFAEEIFSKAVSETMDTKLTEITKEVHKKILPLLNKESQKVLKIPQLELIIFKAFYKQLEETQKGIDSPEKLMAIFNRKGNGEFFQSAMSVFKSESKLSTIKPES